MGRTANETRKIWVGKIVTILFRADSVVVLENSRNELVQTAIKLLEASKFNGTNKIYTYKCFLRNDGNDLNLQVDFYIFEKV